MKSSTEFKVYRKGDTACFVNNSNAEAKLVLINVLVDHPYYNDFYVYKYWQDDMKSVSPGDTFYYSMRGLKGYEATTGTTVSFLPSDSNVVSISYYVFDHYYKRYKGGPDEISAVECTWFY